MSSPLPPSSSLARAPTLAGQARLVHLGVMRALGADAVAFLQGQLTQDVALMGPQDARLAAYCNAKGRMQASFIVVQPRPDELLLVCRRDVLPAMVKRLSMFVLRSKVKLSDASDEFTLLGLAGEQAVHPRPWQRRDEAGAQVISLYPGAGVPLALWLAPAQEPLPQGPALEPAAWQWLMVRSGIALVGQDSFEAYVPQMLNYESVGGVSFKKGCYPGQEVVARSQFRGTLKRRAYLAHAQGPVATGQEVFHALEPSQPCGSVAAAAACPDGAGWDAIVCLQVSAAEEACAGLRAQGADGPALDLMELPYPLLVDL